MKGKIIKTLHFKSKDMNSNNEMKLFKGLFNICISKALRESSSLSRRSSYIYLNFCRLSKKKDNLSQNNSAESRPILNGHPCRPLYLSSNAATKLEYSSNGKTSSVVKDVLETCSECLIAEDIENARLEAEYIVSHALGIERHSLESRLFESISCDVADKIDQMMGCRLSRMPLQYIIGNWDFHSITLQLRPPVFIPRPETEELVNISLKYLDGIENPLVADLCCGSGAISLALLHNNSQLKCIAVDQSKYAVRLAIDNAKYLELSERISVIKGKITDLEIPISPHEKFDLIVSNPPYVLKKDLMLLQPEIFLYEDLRALDGGIDGLDIIRNIINHGENFLKKDGVMLLEIDPCHKYLLPTLLDEKNTSFKITKFHDDYNGICRFVELRLK